MCGICGVFKFSGLTSQDIADFTHVLLASQLRGEDATGIADQEMNVYKNNVTAAEFVATQAYKDFTRSCVGQQWLLGHTRHATRGDPAQNWNNHPITTAKGRFVLIHNGIVYTTNPRIAAREDQTDTYIIANAIKKELEENSLFDATKEAYKLFQGSAATAVASTNELVLTARNSPLRIATTASGARIFASDTDFFPKGVHNTLFFKNLSIFGWSRDGSLKSGEVQPSSYFEDWRSFGVKTPRAEDTEQLDLRDFVDDESQGVVEDYDESEGDPILDFIRSQRTRVKKHLRAYPLHWGRK